MKKMISRRNFLKVCAVAGSAVALSACCGSKKAAAPDPSNTDQTSFDIVGGQSALSPGYNDNEVLKKLADNVGVKLNYETMSDSLSEQVNIRIAGDQLPDAFMGVGFSNYDIANGFTYFLQDFKLQGGKVGGGSPHFLFQQIGRAHV